MSDSQSLSVQSWSDVYQLLRAKAEASRGTITLTPSDAPRVTYPHTISRDAFALALVFDTAVNEHASAIVATRWIWEMDLLGGEPEDSTDPYVGNRSLWDTLPAVASELDRAQAPLPAQSVIDDAIRELETPRPTVAEEIRNGATTMLVTVFTESTWKAMARRQLQFFCRLRGEQVAGNPFVPNTPQTSNADVLSLADYWTDQLARIGARATDTYHRMVYSCWREVLYHVQRHAKHAPAHETYIHNSEFWTALMLLTTQSDACDASPAPWAFHVPSCAPPYGQPQHQHPRNAAAVDTGATLDFPAAKTWDEAAQMQRDAFSKLRGEDAITGRLISRVPRTTVADVRQLAAYWSAGLAKVGEHSFADVSYRHVIDRWKAAVAEVDRTPLTTDPTSVYAHNADFWEAVITISIQVAVTAEAPTRWQLVKEAAKQTILEPFKAAVKDLVSGAVARPLLYAGIGVAGIAVVLLLTRGSSHGESRP